MKNQLNVYLTFSGKAEEAMTFYRDILGGKLEIMKVCDTPAGEKCPEGLENQVMHSSLSNGNLMLYATDMVAGDKLTEGNGMSLCLTCESEDDLKTIYKNLSEGGEQIHPVKKEFWGGMFGVLKDKFGKVWMLNSEKK
mgnify:FL=1